jgi:hypothetical protein
MSKVKQQFIKGAGVAVAVALTGASMQASALTINFTAAAGMSAAAITGFSLRAIDVNVDIDFTTLGAGFSAVLAAAALASHSSM